MTTKESLNREYERVCNWQSEYSRALSGYLEKTLEFLGGVAELKDYYRTVEEAEEHDMDFIDQFPASFELFDKHNFIHDIFITKVYRKYDIYFVDGFDNTDGKWVEGWFTDGSDATKETLAYFIDFVLNPEADSENTEEVEEDKGFVPQLIGFQLLDEDNCYPSEMGAWDVFATREDAEEYKQTMLDVNEWHIIEEWSTPNVQPSMFRYHRSEKHTFEKG